MSQFLWVDFCLNTSCGLHLDMPCSDYSNNCGKHRQWWGHYGPSTTRVYASFKQLVPGSPAGFFGTLAILEAMGEISCSTWHWLPTTTGCRGTASTFCPGLDMAPTWSVSMTGGKCVCCSRAPPPGHSYHFFSTSFNVLSHQKFSIFQ